MDFIKSLPSRKLFWLGVIYLGLLIWSGIYRSNMPEPKLTEGKKEVLLNAIEGKRKLAEKIRVAYKEKVPSVKTESLPVILIHGSPGSSDAFDELTNFIDDRRLISIDLPGFGSSEPNVPDYSIDAYAEYVLELMKRLKIAKAHFAGFSLGGGVVLDIADRAPNRVASISLISSIGVQEYELLGNYWINHTVHMAQFGFFLFLKEFTPHFGFLDSMLIPYARSFYDTDQRPLRKILEKIEMPVLIIHGNRDPLVPIEAARENARLMPQSEYHELDENHFFIFLRPKKIEKTLRKFWNKAEKGEAKTRINAAPKRIKESQKPFIPKIFRAQGSTALVFFLLLAILTFISEDLAFLLGGFFAAQGRFGLAFAIISCTFGIGLCVLISMSLARQFAANAAQVETDESSFVRKILNRKFFSFRFLEYFSAGKTRDRFWKHIFVFVFSAIIYASAITTGSFLLTKLLDQTSLIDSQNTLSAVPVFAAFIISLIAYRIYNNL